MSNKVIIIGGPQFNTLGAIRAFGEKGVKPYLLLIGSENEYILKSKYICKYWVFSDEKTAVCSLSNIFSNESEKPILIPTSDMVASLLDDKYNVLCKNFFLHSIDHKEGSINLYMNKYEQYLLFKKCDVNCLKSTVVDIHSASNYLDNISFPCIVKPYISAGADKSDIEICKNKQDLVNCFKTLRSKGYSNVLVQDYLDYDCEYDVTGFSFQNDISFAGLIKKIRIWPNKKGSTTFGLVSQINNDELSKKIKNIFSYLNYNGIFDIDFFEKDGKLFFNEINFRNSALSYAYRDNYPAYYWFLSCSNNKFQPCPKIANNYTFMNDLIEIHHVLERSISPATYIKDRKNCKILLVRNNEDPSPSRTLFQNRLKNMFVKINKKI